MQDFLDIPQRRFLEALEHNMGVVSLTLEETNYSRALFEQWMEEVFFKQKVKEIEDRTLDIVERKLHEKISAGDLNAIQFYLKTKGRNRGYV